MIRRVLLIGCLMWLTYAVALDRFLVASGEDPMLIIFGGDLPRSIGDLPNSFRVLHITMAGSIVGMLIASMVRRVRGPVIAGLLFLPFAVVGLGVFEFPLLMLMCVPSSLLGLWAVHRMQRFRRMPIVVPLAAFAWGAFVATGFAAPVGYLFRIAIKSFLTGLYGLRPTVTELAQANLDTAQAALMFAGVNEELAKIAGVAVVCLLVRHHIDGMVSGIVVGAACGLGFNFAETVGYMVADPDGAGHQFFMRQSVGLLAAHTAFAALAGAGIGAARQLTERRAVFVACGLLGAIGGHALSNTTMSWYGQHAKPLLPVSPTVEALVVQPGLLILVQGPVVVMYLVLLHRASRTQAGGLKVQLRAEVLEGSPAVAEAEMPVLLNPAQRFWLRVRLLRRYGFAAWRNSGRLHQAQLDLATQRWHHARLETDPRTPGLPGLRARVVALKRRQAAIHTAAGTAPEPVEVPT